MKSRDWTSYAATALFVLLWSSGALFSKIGLLHASAFALLVLRFAIALCVLSALAIARRRWLPEPEARARIASTGALLIGCYAICFLLALDRGMTPGALATVLGVQPLLTLLISERRFSMTRLLGLAIAFLGLTLVVWQSLIATQVSAAGALFALAALASVTAGAVMQKAISQPPMEVLPLQYAVTLLLCAGFVPFQPFTFELSAGFLIPVLWLGLAISVAAQLLLYRLIQAGNLVNVTSLFYLVPVVTAALDYAFLGNRLPALSIAGMGAILLGLMLVFRR